jgi:hypothetical protein
MYTLRPSVAPFLFHRTACKVKPGLIKEGAKLVQAGHPNHDWCRVCQGLEAVVALPQGGLSLLDNPTIHLFGDTHAPIRPDLGEQLSV